MTYWCSRELPSGTDPFVSTGVQFFQVFNGDKLPPIITDLFLSLVRTERLVCGVCSVPSRVLHTDLNPESVPANMVSSFNPRRVSSPSGLGTGSGSGFIFGYRIKILYVDP